MRKRKTKRGGGFGSDKDGGRHNERERKFEEEERRRDFFLEILSPCFSLQTDAKADGGELAENGQRRNETVY